METNKKVRQAPRWRSIILLTVGVIGIAVFVARLALSSAVETEKIEKSMNNAASEMSSIQSRAGTSIDEAYYQAEGKYLAQEAKAWEALLNSATGMRVAVDILGLLASVALFVSGSRMKG